MDKEKQIRSQVSNWLNGNKVGIDIFFKKYRLDNEGFDEWLERISGGNSYLQQAILEKRVALGGRILANRGTERTVANCFTEDAIVNTDKGLISIKDIKVGDYVVTAGGTYERVNAIMERDYSGDLFVINSKNIMRPITCTPNHKYLTNKGWVRADRLCYKENHLLTIPTVPKKDSANCGLFDLSTLELPDKINKIVSENTIEYSVNMNMKGTNCNHKSGVKINRFIDLDNADVRYMIGRWLGDGSVTRRKGTLYDSIVQIVFNATTESEDADRINKILINTFGISTSVSHTNQNVIAVRIENPFIGTFFSTLFGKGCSGKKVPNMFDGDMDIACGLLDADGTILSHGAVRITLKNINLITWLRNTLYKNGINTLPITKHTVYKDTYSIQVPSAISRLLLTPMLNKTYHDKRKNIKYDDSNLAKYIQISDIEILENQKCKVYNLSVEKDHTYTVNGVVVHNCFILPPPKDSIAGIMDQCTKMALTYKQGGGCGFDVSTLRPIGAKITGQEQPHKGLEEFAPLFSAVTGAISGKGRRGALSMIIDADHPNVIQFINLKKDKHNGVEKANLSVKLSNEFIKKAITGEKENKKYKVESTGEEIEHIVDYKFILNEIVEKSRISAEPGIVFWDNANNNTLCSGYKEYDIVGLNP